jgi:nitrogen regulatory protein P-II 2
LPRGNCFATAHTSRTINGGAAPQAADLSVVVGAVGAGVMMQAMMLWLLLHYQRILGLRNAWLLRQEMDVLMKLVTAIIRPFKLDEVRDALTEIGVQGLTVTEVQGYGRQKGHTEIYRGAEYGERLLPKIKVEIACLSNQVDKIIKTITSSAKTGKIGDGKILVYGLDMWCVFAPAKPTLTRSERRFPPAPCYQWSQTPEPTATGLASRGTS